MDSLAGKWNTLKENMTKSITTAGVRDSLKGALDIANKLVEAFNKISTSLGSVGTLGIGAGLMSFIKMMSGFSSYSGLSGITSGLVSSLGALGSAFNNINTSGFKGGIKATAMGLKDVAKASGLAKVGAIALNSALNAIVWTAVIAGIQAVVKAYDDYKHATENTIKASKERQDGYRDEAQTLNTQITGLSELSEQYDELNSKTNLTAEEFQKLRDLKKQIADIAPDLVTGYDINNDPIIGLSGNLDNYIKKLQQARDQKEKLMNYETRVQANASLSDEKDTVDYMKKLNERVKQVQDGDLYSWSTNTAKGIDAIKKANQSYQNQVNNRMKMNSELTESNAEYMEADNRHKTALIGNLQEQSKAYKNLIPKMQSDVQGFVQGLDLGDFTQGQFRTMQTTIDKMMQSSTSIQAFSKQQRDAITSTKQAYTDGIGSIQEYGNAINTAFRETGKISFDELNQYMESVKTNFSNTGDIQEYRSQMSQLAQTISQITKTDYDTVYKGLTNWFDIGALEEKTVALDRFLDNNKKSIDEWAKAVGDGGKQAKETLTESFNNLNSFLETSLSSGGFDVDYLKTVKDTLPKQLSEIANQIVKDNEATELEQKFMVAVSTEFANEGEITEQTIGKLQDLLNGEDVKMLEIGGFVFKGDELNELKSLLDSTGWSAEQLKSKLQNNGLDGMLKDANELSKALDNLQFDKKVNDAIRGLSFDNVGGLNALKEAVGQFKDVDTQIKFTADCGQFFEQASSMQEAIQNMKNTGNGHLILKYDLDVQGDEELQRVKDAYKDLPETVRTLIDNKVIGFENVEKVHQYMTEDGASEKTITTLMELKGADEVLSKSQTYKEFLEGMKGLIVTSQLNLETTGEEELEEVTTTVEGADGTTSTMTLNMTTDAKEKYELVMSLLNELNGEESNPTIKPEVDNTELEKGNELKEKASEDTSSNHKNNCDSSELEKGNKEKEKAKEDTESNTKFNADTTELEKAEEKLDKLTENKDGTFTLNVQGAQQLTATVNDKKQLEVDGKAVTYVTIDGGEKIPVAINEKGQLEVDGQALTNVQVNGGEKLTFYKDEKGQLQVTGVATTNVVINGDEKITATKNDKGQLEVNGQAITTVQIDGGEKYSVAINEKGQLEVNGQALTNLDVTNLDKLTFAKNEKGELEVNGQSITDLVVNGKEEPKEAKENVQELHKMDGKNVSVNIDVSLKETVGEILSRLGLSKKTETVELKVTCTDEATPKINKILQNNNKPVTFKMNADSANVDNTVKKVRDLGASPISIKLNCNADQVTTTIQNITSITSKPFTFNVTAPGASEAYNSISKIQNIQASPKSFTVTAPGSSDAYNAVLRIKNCTIGNKRFTVTAPGSRDAYNAVVKIKNTNIPNKRFTITAPGSAGVISALSTIKSKLDSIHGKAIRVSVTTVYKTVGKPSKEAGGSSANEPEIIKLAKPSFGSGATTQALSGTTQALSGEIQAINNNAETLNNAVSTTGNSAELMASKKVKANIDTSKTIDAVKRNIDLLTNMSNLLSKLATQIDTLQAKQQRTWGSGTIKLLKQQISLLTKQQSLTKVNIKNMEGMSKKLKSSLKKQGFKFKDDGTISNYNSKLLAMEKNVERLEKKEEKYNKKHKDTSKLSKKKQKAVEKQQEANSKATEKARKKLDETKQKLQEYYDLQFNELPNAKKDWEEYANAIADAKAEIIKADREAKTFFENAKEERLNFEVDKSSTKADTYMTKSDMAKSWKESVKWINKANEELEKNKERQKEISRTAKNRAYDNKKVLSKNGFKFNSDGSIKDAENKLESLKKKLSTPEYEAIKEAYDEYMKDMYETIPQAEEEWQKLEEEIRNNKETIMETNKAMQELVDGADLTQLTASYERLNDELSLSETKMERVHGKNKLKYIQEQMNLLEQMTAEQKKIARENKSEAGKSKMQLSEFGVKFDENGDITNLESVLKRIKKSGSLEDMEKLNELVENYNSYMKDMRDANQSVEENRNKIEDLKDSVIELNKELDDMKTQAWATEFDNDIKVVQNRLDKLDAQIDLSNGSQLDLLNEKIKVYEELAKATEDSLNNKLSRKGDLSTKLESYGFKINDDGTIDNTAERLERLKNSLSDTEFDVVNDYLQEYFNVALDEIPELEKQLLEYQKAQKDIQEEKLNKTKEIEDKITDIYEKQLEERKKQIEEEKDAQVKALNEAKEAYNRYRNEVDYKDDYNKQLKTVEDLQKKIEIAKRDDSLAGQKRLADLMNQLQEEQENLENMVQDKIDEDINQMFDDQIDKTETDAEDEIKNLEDTWTESKIAEMVEQALNTGVFTDIDGNIKTLDSALLEFANNSSEYFGVMGASLKEQLLDNLNIALETMQEIKNLSGEVSSTDKLKNNVSMPKNTPSASMGYIPPSDSKIGNNVSIGDTSIVVQGNADDKVIAKIQGLLEENNQKVYATIMKNVK